MTTPPPSSTPREALLAAWAAVEQANLSLRYGASTLDATRVRELLVQGAVLPTGGVGPYRRALAQDDTEFFGLMLDGSEMLNADCRWHLLLLGIEQRAPKCVALMIERGFPLVEPDDNTSQDAGHVIGDLDGTRHFETALATAAHYDSFDCAQLLLAAGAAKRGPDPSQALTEVKSVAMFDLLIQAGLVPTREHTLQAVFTPQRHGYEVAGELLGRFIDAGVDMTRRPGDEWSAWTLLLEQYEKTFTAAQLVDQAKSTEAQLVGCGRHLLKAGITPEQELVLGGDVFALALLAQAGFPIERVMALAVHHFEPRPVSFSRTAAEDRAMASGAALRILARQGADIDVFWHDGASPLWEQTMILAGVDPGDRRDQFEEGLLAAGMQARLEDRTPITAAAPRVPRL